MYQLKDSFIYPKKFDNLIYTKILPPQKKYNFDNNISKNIEKKFTNNEYNLIDRYIYNNIPINNEYSKNFNDFSLQKLNYNNIKYENLQINEKSITKDLFNNNIKYYNYLKTICLNQLPIIKKSDINKEKKNNKIIDNIININYEKYYYNDDIQKEEEKINNINNIISYIIKTDSTPKEENVERLINNIKNLDDIPQTLKEIINDLDNVNINKYLEYYEDNIVNNLIKNNYLNINNDIYNELYRPENNYFFYQLIKKNPNILIINNLLKIKKNHKEELIQNYNIKDNCNYLDVLFIPEKEIHDKKISKDVLKLNIEKCLDIEKTDRENFNKNNQESIYDNIILNYNNINYNKINDINKINNIYLENLLFYLKKHNLLIDDEVINKINYNQSIIQNNQYIIPVEKNNCLINNKDNKINKEVYNKKVNNLINFKKNDYKYDNVEHCNIIENNNKDLSREFLLYNNYNQKIKNKL